MENKEMTNKQIWKTNRKIKIFDSICQSGYIYNFFEKENLANIVYDFNVFQ